MINCFMELNLIFHGTITNNQHVNNLVVILKIEIENFIFSNNIRAYFFYKISNELIPFTETNFYLEVNINLNLYILVFCID